MRGDVHDIGKSLVCMMMGAAGFKIRDLGVDVAPERFIGAGGRLRPQIVTMSAACFELPKSRERQGSVA